MLAIAALLALAGCTIERNGVVHHVIIGFGVVSVNKTNVAAQVVRTHALGVYASGPVIAAGYLSQLTTDVQTNSNVIIEIRR